MSMNSNKLNDDMSSKLIKYFSITIAILAIILVGILAYSRSLNEEVKKGTLTSEQISNILNTENDNTESASTEMGKTVEEAEEELNQTTNNTASNRTETKSNTNSANQVLTTDKITPTASTNSSATNTTEENNTEVQESMELTFEKPVEGDIVRDFAVESLIYSETLQEWTTHTGIDIKADKTTVVKAAEAGTIKSIKNDPRYGLTVIIEHANGFQTVYSNLLSSEFVVEGEKVEKGQSLGTVGNTAAFESADEPHLHFEIIKDGTQVDPNVYLK